MSHIAPTLGYWGGSGGDDTHFEFENRYGGTNILPGANLADVDPINDCVFAVARERGDILRMNHQAGDPAGGANFNYAWLYKLSPVGTTDYVNDMNTTGLRTLRARSNSAAISYRIKDQGSGSPIIPISAVDITDGVYDDVLDGYAEQWYHQWQLNTSITHYCEIQSEANIGDPVYDPTPDNSPGQPTMLEPWEPYGANAFAYIVQRWEDWNGGALPMHDKIKIILSLTAKQFPGAHGGQNAEHFFRPTGGPDLFDYCDIVGADMYIKADQTNVHFTEFGYGYDYALANGKKYAICEWHCLPFTVDPNAQMNEYLSVLPWAQARSQGLEFIMFTWGNGHQWPLPGSGATGDAIQSVIEDQFWGSTIADTTPPGVTPEVRFTTPATSETANLTTHTAQIPAGVQAGDRVLLFVEADGTPTFTPPSSPAFTAGRFSNAADGQSLGFCYRDWTAPNVGTTSVTYTTSALEKCQAQVVVLRSGTFKAGVAPEYTAVVAQASGSTLNPAAITPTWTDATRVFGHVVVNNANTVSLFPDNLPDSQSTSASSGTGSIGGGVASGEADILPYDPLSFTLGTGTQPSAAETVAVRGVPVSTTVKIPLVSAQGLATTSDITPALQAGVGTTQSDGVAATNTILPKVTVSKYTESFNKSDSTTLGPDRQWTEVTGGLSVVSNKVEATSRGSTRNIARAEKKLQSVNHYVQAQLTALEDPPVAGQIYRVVLAGRYDQSADTCYFLEIKKAS